MLVFAAEEGGGSFLVSPSLGLMIWTLIAFGTTAYILNKLAFPRIAEALDRRRRAIEESIDSAEKTRREADELLEEYRARLREAREQSEDIVARARKAADALQESRELRFFFFSPYFSSEEKRDAIERILEGADEHFVNFLKLLAERHRMPVIHRIRQRFEQLWAEERRLLPVSVT